MWTLHYSHSPVSFPHSEASSFHEMRARCGCVRARVHECGLCIAIIRSMYHDSALTHMLSLAARTMILHSHTHRTMNTQKLYATTSHRLFRDTCSEVNGCQSLYLHGLLRFSLRQNCMLAHAPLQAKMLFSVISFPPMRWLCSYSLAISGMDTATPIVPQRY